MFEKEDIRCADMNFSKIWKVILGPLMEPIRVKIYRERKRRSSLNSVWKAATQKAGNSPNVMSAMNVCASLSG